MVAIWTSFDNIVTFLSNFSVATTSSLVIVVVLNVTSNFGAVLSIHVTFAVVLPLLPLSSTYSNVNSPFSVNVWVILPSLLVTVIGLIGLTNSATTSLLVGFTML